MAEISLRTVFNQNPQGDGGQGDNGGQPAGNPDDEKAKAGGEGGKPEAKPEGGSPKGGGDGGTAEPAAWVSQLPDDLKGNTDTVKRLSKFAKIGELAKSYLELESRAGNAAAIPGKDSSEEERAAFWKKLGKPEEKTGYSIAKDKEAGVFLDMAHGSNLTDAQATAVFEHIRKLGTEQIRAQKDALDRKYEETEAALKKEYGGRFDEKIELLRRGAKLVDGGMGKYLESSGLLAEPGIVRAFIKLGELTAESGAPRGGGTPAGEYKGAADGGGFGFRKT